MKIGGLIEAPGATARRTRLRGRLPPMKIGGLIEASLRYPSSTTRSVLPPMKIGGLIEATHHPQNAQPIFILPPMKIGGLIEAALSLRSSACSRVIPSADEDRRPH